MPLAFDDRDLLPEGVHDATLDEIVSAFGGTSRRDQLCDHLREYLACVQLTGWACEVLLDGSFVMPKVREPNDIDVIVILPDDWSWDRRDFRPFEYNVIDKGRSRRAYRVEVQPVLGGSARHHEYLELFTQVRVEWCRQFGLPTDSRKGLVRLLL